MAKSDLYIGKDYINEIYAGSEIISQIYRGSHKIYDVYYDGEVLLEQNTAGSYSFTPKVRGIYEVILVGAGGGGAAVADQPKYHYKSGSAGGGSGAYIRANIFLEGGVEYPITVGAGGAGSGGSWGSQRTGGTGGNSLFGDLLTCKGGTGGYARWTDGSPSDCRAGVGGSFEYNGDILVVNSSNGKNGAIKNNGYGSISGGASVFGSYGAGGNAGTDNTYGSATAGGNGYIRISYLKHGLIGSFHSSFRNSVAGNYTFTPDTDGVYEVILVGAGGGGACSYSSHLSKTGVAGGGSGAYIYGEVTLSAGTEYNITIGSGGNGLGLHNNGVVQGGNGGDTILEGFATAGGGTGGYARWTDGTPEVRAGVGGENTIDGDINVIDNITGNNGGTSIYGHVSVSGGASTYNGFGYGGKATGDSDTFGTQTVSGGDGFVKIQYLRGSL